MTARRPLVNVDGSIQELPTADTLAGVSPGGASGAVQGNTAGVFAAVPNFTYDVATGALTAQQSTANTVVDAITLETTNAATVGAQKWSPEMMFKGYGWKTTATAASQLVGFGLYVKPAQGTTKPTGTFVFAVSIGTDTPFTALSIGTDGQLLSVRPQITNGAAYSFVGDSSTGLGIAGATGSGVAAIFAAGTLVASFNQTTGIFSGLDIGTTGTAGKLYAISTSTAATSRDGLALETTTAATIGNQQYSPRVRWKGFGWKTTATAASQAVEFAAEARPVQGTANPTGSWVLSAAINGGAYTDVLTVGSNGVLTVNSAGLAASITCAGANGSIAWAGGEFRLLHNGSAVVLGQSGTSRVQVASSVAGGVGAPVMEVLQDGFSNLGGTKNSYGIKCTGIVPFNLSAPAFHATQTWNAAQTFYASYLDITDTSSNADSSFVDYRVATVSKARIQKDGTGFFANVTSAGVVKVGSYTVSTLPSAATSGAGSMAMASDLLSLTNGVTATAGGSNKGIVKSDGSAWIVLG